MTERNRLICLLTKIVPLPFKKITAIADGLVSHGVIIQRTGHWEEKQIKFWIYAHCPICDTTHNTKTNYCPNCGTKMI